MESLIYNQKNLESYLLNELPSAEITALEDEFLRNDELFQFLETVEMNLIDRYLENEMTEDEKQRFETTFLKSPAHQWKLEEARVFRESLDRLRNKQLPPQNIQKIRIFDKSFFRPRHLPQIAAAAIVLLLFTALIGWLAFRSSRQPTSNNLSTQVVPPPPTNENNRNTTPPQDQPSPSPTKRKPRERVRKEWLYLRDQATGVMGSGVDRNITLSDNEVLRLQFELLDDAGTKDVVQVSIKDQRGYPLFSSGTIDVKPIPVRYGGLLRRAISVDIPVSSLKLGERYRFEIVEPYASKTFVVKRPANR